MKPNVGIANHTCKNVPGCATAAIGTYLMFSYTNTVPAQQASHLRTHNLCTLFVRTCINSAVESFLSESGARSAAAAGLGLWASQEAIDPDLRRP